MTPEDLLHCLNTFSTTHDNAARSAIESRLEESWKASAVNMMLSLQSIIANPSIPLPSRTLAAVLLRRGMSKTSTIDVKKTIMAMVPAMERQAVVQGLLSVLRQPQPADLLNKVADAVAEAARLAQDLSELVLNFVGESLTTGSSVLLALRILEESPNIIQNSSQHAQFGRLLGSVCQQAPSADLLAAIMATVVSLLMTVSDQDKKAYGECVKAASSQPCLQRLISSLSEDDEEMSNFLSSLIDGVFEAPKMFKEVVEELFQFGLLIAQRRNLDVGVRSLGVELVLCLVEGFTGVFKKKPHLVQSGLRVILEMMCEVEDCREWYEAEGQDDDDEIDEVAVLGEQAIDRFAMALTGRVCAEPLFALVSGLLNIGNDQEWRFKYGALKAIASSAEGMMDVIEDRLEQVLSFVWPFFAHPHPRIQYAACHALGQLCTDFDGAVQRDFTKQSLEGLVGVLSRSTTVRVQQHAAAALVNFAEGVDANQLSPFLDGILSRLVLLLTTSGSDKSHLQQQLIATIASFSTAAESKFTQYLPSLMPMMMQCLNNQQDRLLQCRAVEAMSIFALAVKKEAFFKDPHGAMFMEFMREQEVLISQETVKSDDQMAEYLQTSWVRMCQVLQADFVNYLPVCLPRMIKQAQAEADVAVLDAEDQEGAKKYDESEWDFADINGRRFGIHTACLEEKCVALENIAALAGTMGAAFAPFCQDCLFSLALPLLDFDLHDGVEAAAADLVSACCHCLALSNAPQVAQSAAVQSLSKLMETAKSKYSAEYTTAALDAINAILADELVTVGDAVVEQVMVRAEGLGKFAVKRVMESVNTEEEDEDDHDEDQDDGEVVYAVARLYATLCKRYHEQRHQSNLMQILTTLALPQLDPNRRRPTPLQHAGLCMLVDAIQWIPDRLAQQNLPIPAYLQTALRHSDRDVCQAAVFGCGVLGEARVKTPQWEQFLVQILPVLVSMSTNKTASTAAISDNCVSACIKIMAGTVDIHIAPTLWSVFPILADSAEFNTAYGFLASCLDNPQFKPSLCKSKNILESCLEACCGSSVSKHVNASIKNNLKQHIPDLIAGLGPVAEPIMSRYDTSLLH